jgi:hypothetical protein
MIHHVLPPSIHLPRLRPHYLLRATRPPLRSRTLETKIDVAGAAPRRSAKSTSASATASLPADLDECGHTCHRCPHIPHRSRHHSAHPHTTAYGRRKETARSHCSKTPPGSRRSHKRRMRRFIHAPLPDRQHPLLVRAMSSPAHRAPAAARGRDVDGAL